MGPFLADCTGHRWHIAASDHRSEEEARTAALACVRDGASHASVYALLPDRIHTRHVVTFLTDGSEQTRA